MTNQQNIVLGFNINNGKLALTARVKGSSSKNYKQVSGLINPDLKTWNGKLQRFEGDSSETKHNNKVLQQMMESHLAILNTLHPQTPREALWPKKCVEYPNTRPSDYIPHPGVKATLTLADFDDNQLFTELRRRGFTGELRYSKIVSL